MKAREFISEGQNGPHSGKEVEMMMAGTKPAALLSNKEKERLNSYIKTGKMYAILKPDKLSWIVVQKDEAWRLDKIWELLKQNERDWEEGVSFDTPRTLYNANLGRMLGYSEDDINYHLNYVEKKRQQQKDEYRQRIEARKNKENSST